MASRAPKSTESTEKPAEIKQGSPRSRSLRRADPDTAGDRITLRTKVRVPLRAPVYFNFATDVLDRWARFVPTASPSGM